MIGAIRNQRAELNVPKDKKPDIKVMTNDDDIKDMYVMCDKYIKTLASVSSISFDIEIKDMDKYVSLTFDKSKVFIPFNELVDTEKEKIRISDEIKKVESEINRAKGMLSNERFVEKAPKEKIDEEKEKLKKYEQMLVELKNSLEKL